MTQKEYNDGNRLIAQFIGYEYIPFNNPMNIKAGWWHNNTSNIIKLNVRPDKLVGSFYLGRSVKDLKYHKDWNYLMNACRKWDKLNEHPIPIAANISLKKVEEEYVALCEELDHFVTLYEIMPAFKHLVDCIRWYNNITQLIKI